MTFPVIAGRKQVDRALTDAEVLPLERAVIGGVLLENGARMPQLLAHEFFLELHRDVWNVLIDTVSDGRPVDPLLLLNELEGRHPGVWYATIVAQCLEEASIAAYLMDYARLVRDAARARMIRALGVELANQGMSEDEIRKRLDALPGSLTADQYDPALDWRAIVDRWRDQRIMTGLPRLDRLSGGLTPGMFVVVAGRTSHGKTAMLVHVSLAYAEAGHLVEYITLEEPQAAITRRAIANRSGVTLELLSNGRMLQTEFQRSEEAVRWLQNQPWRVTGVEQLRDSTEGVVLGAVAASTATVVVIDHMQKILSDGDSRQYDIERIVTRLQAIALRDGKLIISGAQLGRAMDDPPRRPRLTDIRDSASIEHAARQVWLLYWPVKHDQKADPNAYELFVAKHSDGASGKVDLRFNPECGRFADAR